MNYLDGLNPEQKQAVEAGEGPLLIIAGPGTGKTKTLTTRIIHLIQTGRADPDCILALTFTNKAAREMKERVTRHLRGNGAPTITTFHALAHSILKDENIALLDATTHAEILRSLKKAHATQLSQRDIALMISNAKNSLHEPADPAVSALIQAYNAELASRGLWDFDDLLIRLREWLLQRPAVTYTHVLVDEFQDTNDLQYELLKLLNTSDNLFVIGDPLQAIYGFRGASDGIFDRFLTDWPAARTIQLSVNYRSAPAVVAASNAIFAQAPQLAPHRDSQGSVQAVEVLNEYSEAEWVTKEIERQVGGTDLMRSSQYDHSNAQRCFGDFAVLYRTHAVAKTLQKYLEASGIPYQVAGEGSPFLQPAVQELLQAMACMAGRAKTAGKRSLAQTQQILNTLRNANLPLSQLAVRVCDTLGIGNERNRASLAQYMSSLVRFDDQPIEVYLDYVEALAEQEYYDPKADAVALLTIHAAKGLEFSQVFLVAAEQGVLPLRRQGQAPDFAEEKRLFYVAVTRARDDLFLLHASRRAKEKRHPSPFLEALPSGIARWTTDPAMAAQIRKLQRRQQRRAQGSLF